MGVLARNCVMALNNVTITNSLNAALWVEEGSNVRARNTRFNQTQSNAPWVLISSRGDTLYVDNPAALTPAQIHMDSAGPVSSIPAARAVDSVFPRVSDPGFVQLQQVRHQARL